MGYDKKVQTYKRDNYNCRLCLEEKLCILENAENNLLNIRSELIAKRRHINNFPLCHLPPAPD